ncbi:unnamed protein product [Rotaria sp. Silwood2]|nr:unnamed protein product [Rotaria sp. Silwood2]CAF2811767.1 unnamed protein product [Rotaria sp. Silwood2]CAF3399981.1 unnamed protein product [Rotaria sp. Silwood2]CAF3895948.1 unnamed protein product [Rotaria sp. Silwood2]CAF3963733.1 unnamed protein product [Rotaria sp. Silwood2]
MGSKGVIVVYGMTVSPATQRVLATLIEKGLDYELKVVDLMSGEHLAPEYLQKQPFGTIPTLIDADGFKIYESRAICRYLETKYKGHGTELVPKDNKALGLFEQGVAIESSNFDSLANQIASEKIFKRMRGGEPDMAKVTQLRRDLSENLDVYEKILSKQPYIGGQTFTLADLFHLPCGVLLVKAGESDLFESRPHVKQWWNKISSRPAWKSVAAMI